MIERWALGVGQWALGSGQWGRWLGMAGLCLGLVFSAGCMRGCTSSRPPIHLVPNMDNQPKALPQSSSDFFYNGAAMRTPVEGTVARGSLPADEAFHTGLGPDGGFVANPLEIDDELLAGGR